MNRLPQLVVSIIAGAALVYAGFYLTGIGAANTSPKELGLTAGAVFALLMLFAWGLPAFILWSFAGFVIQRRHLHFALLGAATEILILFSFSLLPAATNASLQAELGALASALVWPVAFIAVLSPLGSLLGAKVRVLLSAAPGSRGSP